MLLSNLSLCFCYRLLLCSFTADVCLIVNIMVCFARGTKQDGGLQIVFFIRNEQVIKSSINMPQRTSSQNRNAHSTYATKFLALLSFHLIQSDTGRKTLNHVRVPDASHSRRRPFRCMHAKATNKQTIRQLYPAAHRPGAHSP